MASLLGKLMATALPVAFAGCAAQPSSICEMPGARTLWQGHDVTWHGEILDLAARYHGREIYFTDCRCGTLVQIDPEVLPTLYPNPADRETHAAVAEFRVAGRLTYEDGNVVLTPRSLTQLSQWKTGDAFISYLTKTQATLQKARSSDSCFVNSVGTPQSAP